MTQPILPGAVTCMVMGISLRWRPTYVLLGFITSKEDGKVCKLTHLYFFHSEKMCYLINWLNKNLIHDTTNIRQTKRHYVLGFHRALLRLHAHVRHSQYAFGTRVG